MAHPSGFKPEAFAFGEVVPASEYRALQAQVSELQRMLGKKTVEAEILFEAVSQTAGQNA